METYTSTLETEVNKTSYNLNKFSRIAELLPHEAIYTKIGDGYKGGSESGWLENLLTPSEVRSHLESGGNVGVRLGEGTQYAAFDIEEKGTLPLRVQAWMDRHAVLTWDSPHTGRNRLVQVNDGDALELLQSYPEPSEEDVELLTDDAVVIPPSSINHATCSDNKTKYGCPGEGTGKYILQSINPDAPTLTVESIERFGQLLEIEPEETDSEETTDSLPIETTGELDDVPDPSPAVNIQKEYRENVPHVSQSFDERTRMMKFGDWDGQERFIQLWNGDFSPIEGSNPKGRAECEIANRIGFFFGRNRPIIQAFMSSLPFETQYEKYDAHRKNLLEWATSVNWVYCEGVGFDMKLTVAMRIWMDGRTTVQEIAEREDVSESQVKRVLPILEAENVIDTHRDGRKRPITNEGITEGYLISLESVCCKFDDTSMGNEPPEPTASNVTRREI